MTPTDLYERFDKDIRERRVVFFAGLPGVGKSLHLRNVTGLAQAAGRKVHLLQWDVTRAAFETDAVLARYPEVDGVTHAAVRKAVGLWARRGVLEWHQTNPDPARLLIGEVPLIGNRLIELAQALDDDVEPLLAGEGTLFITPVPSKEVRQHIEAERQESIARPQHERERADAPPNVLQALWLELHGLAVQLGLTETSAAPAYDPAVYAQTYDHLLRHRNHALLPVKNVLPVSTSVYEVPPVCGELSATPRQVAETLAGLERDFTPRALQAAVDAWHE